MPASASRTAEVTSLEELATEADALAAIRARNRLIRTVRARLKGAGLEVRELASELVISHPGHPERGRIYVRYASGDVSHKRTVWNYLGRLDGYGGTDPDAEPPVDTAAIVGALGARPAPAQASR